ncbi:DUF459 domain-containing protein [Pseudahrensia aquimaris]|uniref:DUF459 domain-containing protein n=1 Tax=Pseudahrensia aquimaris TaxID=744461 RepID=A0ABW3F9Q1_9HYPH
MIKKWLVASCVALLCSPAVGAPQRGPDSVSVVPQVSKPTAPFIRKVPRKGKIELVVLGDSLADGLYIGLKRLNRKNKRLKIVKASRVNTGLVRSDRFDWNEAAREIAQTKRYQVAVVLLGLNDLQTFRERGKRHRFQQKGWVQLYEERIEQMIIDLKKADMAVYWVGIPITAPQRYQKEYAYLNDFFIKAAKKHELRYVDTWSVIAGRDGKYSPFWRDERGKKRKIRTRDGVHFTMKGYVILAEPVNEILRRDIADLLEARAAR